MVFSEVSVTGCAGVAEEIAFERLRNDVSASGGQLAGMLITLFFPAAGEERELKSIMNKLAEMARTHEVDILGGHTEVLDVVTEPIIALTGAGFAAADTNRKSGNFEPGQDIVMTKWGGGGGEPPAWSGQGGTMRPAIVWTNAFLMIFLTAAGRISIK